MKNRPHASPGPAWTAIIFLFLILTGAVAPLAAAGDPPNIILITSDDHRWDALGAAGNSVVHTPHLDRLAGEGVYFRQATVNVSQCLPIRATLLTGLAAHTHGAYAHQNQEPEASGPGAFSDQPTVPGLLRDAGYRTVLVGKWHLGSDPWRVGFDETRVWLTAGGETFVDPRLSFGNSRERKKVRGFTQEIFADSAIDFLEGETAKERPFLLWLAFTAPHAPFGPNPKRIEALYKGTPDAELPPHGFPTDMPTNDWRLYYEGVSHLDEQVGRVLSTLEETGLADSTVVVFLGDNGFMMGEKGVGAQGAAGKVVPYESSIRVPLMIRAPGLQTVPGSSPLQASALDLPPTITALAGVETPPSWPGRSLLPTLTTREAPGFDDSFSEWADDRSKPFGHLAHRLVRTRHHKLIVWKDPAHPRELYDLDRDPREETNLAGREEVTDIEADLLRRLRAWMKRTDDPAQAWPAVEESRDSEGLSVTPSESEAGERSPDR